MLDFSAVFGAGTTCLSAVEYSSSLTSSQDNALANFIFYVSISDNNVYEMNISLPLAFNYSAALYDLQNVSYSYRPIYASHQAINSLFINTGFLMMQSGQTLATTVYSINYSTISTLTGLPRTQTY